MTNEKRLRVDAMQEEEHDSIAKEIAALYAPFSSLLSRCLRVDAERPTRWRSREDVWGRHGGRRVPSAAQSNELLSLFFFVRGFFPFRLGAALDLLAFSNLLPLFPLTKKKTQVTASASFSGDLGLDSLDAVELVMALEEEFGIEIPDAEADKLSSTAEAISYLAAHPQAK
jgi:acyl carrier protein